MNAPASPKNPLFDFGAFLPSQELLADRAFSSDAFQQYEESLEAKLRDLELAYSDWTTRNALKGGRR